MISDVITANLLDFDDHVDVMLETNGNVIEVQVDNHRPSENNNNNNNPPAWVRSPHTHTTLSHTITFNCYN